MRASHPLPGRFGEIAGDFKEIAGRTCAWRPSAATLARRLLVMAERPSSVTCMAKRRQGMKGASGWGWEAEGL